MISKVITADIVRDSIFWEENIAGRIVSGFRSEIILTRV